MGKSFTAQSCHSIGYAWEIETPYGITIEQVEKIVDALIDYTDEPNQENYDAMIKEPTYIEEYLKGIPKSKLKAICIYAESVHREYFSQEIENA